MNKLLLFFLVITLLNFSFELESKEVDEKVNYLTAKHPKLLGPDRRMERLRRGIYPGKYDEEMFYVDTVPPGTWPGIGKDEVST